MERGFLVKALYTNTPEAKNELYFRKGDILTVIEVDHENQPGWWLCALRGQRGICPSNYFEIIEDKYSRTTAAQSTSTPTSTVSTQCHTNGNNVRGGNHRIGDSMEMTMAESVPDSTSCSSSSVILDPLETYDVPKSYRDRDDRLPSSSPNPSHSNSSTTLSKVSPLELYDVPRSQLPIYTPNSHRLHNHNHGDSNDSLSLVRAKNRQSELSLLSTGSSAHLSSGSSSASSSSSARSSASCDLTNTTVVLKSTENLNDPVQSQSDTFFHSKQSQEKETMLNSNSNSNSNRSSVQSQSESDTIDASINPLQELYDVPRSVPTSRAHSAMSALSMSSGLGLSIANSDSKDSLDLYDVPRSSLTSHTSQGSVAAYVNHIETKYDNIHGNNNSNTNSHAHIRTRTPPTTPQHHRHSCSSANLGYNNGKTSTSRTTSIDLSNSDMTNNIKSSGALTSQHQPQSQPDDLYDVPRSSCPVVTRQHNNNISASLASMSMSKDSLNVSMTGNRPHKFASAYDVRRRGIIQTNHSDSNDTLSFPQALSHPHNQHQNQNQQHSLSTHSSYDMLDENTQGSNFSINSNIHPNRSSNHINNSSSKSTPILNSISSSNGCLHSRASFSSCCSRKSSQSYGQPGSEPKQGLQRRVSQIQTEEDVKMLPLNPRAAITVSEKLRHEVITSVKTILDFARPKWRSKSNLIEIMPDLRFSCTRLNLAIKDMADFCTRSVSNAKKFSTESLVLKLQRLLTPLINGSQIIQRDVDELEAYFWSVERLSVSSDSTGKEGKTPPDALDQLVLCARSLLHDVTEVANFLAMNSSALFREPERLNPPSQTISTTNISTSQVISSSNPNMVQGSSTDIQGVESGPMEDYDYVSLFATDEGASGTENRNSSGLSNNEESGTLQAGDSCDSIATTMTAQLLPSDEQLLEFYCAQIAVSAPLLSQSISTFISSIQQNDPPKIFNNHLKYVILIAYKMLFAGDTVHRNIINQEIKEEIETKANELHKSVVSLHEASRDAARNFPKIPPMQKIVERVWATTAAATNLKKVMFNAACF